MASASRSNPQTFNRYSYVLNSPYKFTDPLGLAARRVDACPQCGGQFGLRDDEDYPPFPGIVESTEPPLSGDTEPFVVSNVDTLAQQAKAGTHEGYLSKDPDGTMDYECAELPQSWQNEQEGLSSRVPDDSGRSSRQRRLTQNWTQGAPAVGTDVRSGTVLASGWENGRYRSLERGNHVIILHLWAVVGGQSGAWTIATVHNQPTYTFKTAAELKGFSIVMIPKISVYQPPRPCKTCRFYE